MPARSRSARSQRRSYVGPTKTKRVRIISLPAALVNLLFTSEKRGFVTPSCLDKPFRKIAAAAKIRKPITPRAMRRTAEDLSRLAGVNDLVIRAVSGHSDVAMQELYSTIRGEEMRKSLAAVVQLVGLV